jgi:hypothetical protein
LEHLEGLHEDGNALLRLLSGLPTYEKLRDELQKIKVEKMNKLQEKKQKQVIGQPAKSEKIEIDEGVFGYYVSETVKRMYNSESLRLSGQMKAFCSQCLSEMSERLVNIIVLRINYEKTKTVKLALITNILDCIGVSADTVSQKIVDKSANVAQKDAEGKSVKNAEDKVVKKEEFRKWIEHDVTKCGIGKLLANYQKRLKMYKENLEKLKNGKSTSSKKEKKVVEAEASTSKKVKKTKKAAAEVVDVVDDTVIDDTGDAVEEPEEVVKPKKAKKSKKSKKVEESSESESGSDSE